MESTLALQKADLEAEVGLFLGFGRGAAKGDPAWPVQTQATIESIVRSGLRQWYFPPPAEGSDSSYDWSFLRPMTQVPFPAASSVALLPDDFGGFEGRITFATTGSQVFEPIDLTSVGRVFEAYSRNPSTTGRPVIACEEPIKGTAPTQGQRFLLRLWPISDQAYTLQFAYYILADALTGALPYAYGGMAHAETILESCLAIAEQRLDDASAVHSMKFQERLLASISLDRRNKPQKLGPNMDRSDEIVGRGDWRRGGWPGITVNGVQYAPER